MNTWIAKINQVISDMTQSPGPSRAQTLPVTGGEPAGGKKKSGGFFTLKKK